MRKKLWGLWVVTHWLMALLVIVTFAIGLASLNEISDPAGKVVPLQVHLVLGGLIFALVTARYFMRVLVYKKPWGWNLPAVTNDRKKAFLLDQADRYVHPLLYLATFLMVVLGMAISLPAGLGPTLFFESGTAVPEDFSIYPARAWHGVLSTVLLLLVFQHVLAAVFHVLIKRDGYLRRMWFRRGGE